MKRIIGMVHLKALPTSPKSALSIDAIYEAAYRDVARLEEAGIQVAIVENMFDTPYVQQPSIDTLLAMATLFTRLKESTKMELGLNIQATDGVEEMLLATYCGASFIRAESFVEFRYTSTGLLRPMAAQLLRKRKELNSHVQILADVHVKHSREVVRQEISDVIHQAVEAGADGIILTGLETGRAPSVEDAKEYKEVCGETPLYVGSGVDEKNISELLKYADGAIVGSSIKEDGDVSKPVDVNRTVALLSAIQ